MSPSMGQIRVKNFIEAVVLIAGAHLGATDPEECRNLVAKKLKLTHSGVSRWIEEETMETAKYKNVRGLARIAGIPAHWLGEEATPGNGKNGDDEEN